jgi:hypothetical protein
MFDVRWKASADKNKGELAIRVNLGASEHAG